jgi:methionine-rich copper-binding protein CopC
MKRYAGALAAIFLAIAPVASAHTTLILSDPVHDTTIQQWPDHLSLTFGEPLQVLAGAQINKVSVTNANAASLEGATTINGAVLSVKVAPNSVEGPVLVNYRIAAADGHVLDGEYTFTYKNGVAVAPTSVPYLPHHSSKNLRIVSISTILIVAGLLFGLVIYRRK